jgi:heme-degrading monooxygenase HmoA
MPRWPPPWTSLRPSSPATLGVESAREGVGITVSYWRDLESITAWKRAINHVAAQRLGRERWYATYRVRIALVERDYGFAARPSTATEA